MDQGRRTSNPNGSSGNSSHSFSLPPVTPFDPWHSTPVKKIEVQKMARQSARSPPVVSTRTVSLPIPHDSQMTLSKMESATIQRQRRELQLLIAELKDRDQELNTMAAAHHKQLQAWEQDRQRVLSLEQRCARLEGELLKRNEVIRAITKRVQIVEARDREGQRELNSTQQQLHKLGQTQQHASQQYQDLEERNQSLSSTVMALSTQVGSLQVREEELSTMLRLKDKDVSEATNHIVDMSGRLRELEASLKDSHSRESRVLREVEEHKRRYREGRHENARLKEMLQEQTTESSAQREEIIRFKQEGQLLRRELALSGEGENWKDELLGLARSKQERTESELHCLRQVCENQQNDLQLLQLNLESAREALNQREGQGSHGRSSVVSESMASQGTTRGGGSVHRQALSLNTEPHQDPPFPIQSRDRQESQEESVSGLTSGHVTMVTSDLITTTPTTLLSQSTGQASVCNRLSATRENQSRASHHTPTPYTESQSSYSHQDKRGRESKDTMATCSLTAGTGSLSHSPGQASMRDHLSTVLGNQSMASSRQEQLLSEQESNDSNQETPQRARTETMATLSSLARSTRASMRSTPDQVSFSDRTAKYNHWGQANRQGRETASQSGVSGKVDSMSRTSDQMSCQGTAGGTTGREDKETPRESGITTNAGSLVERTESTACGCSSVAEGQTGPSSYTTTTCGCSSSMVEGQTGSSCSIVEGQTGRSCSIVEGQTGRSCSIVEGQTGPSCSIVEGQTECSCIAGGQTRPSCGCRCSHVPRGQGEVEPCGGPSEAGTGTGMDLLAVFNGRPEAEDSSILLLDLSPRALQDSQCPCQGDLTCVYLDNPSPSSRSRRSPTPANDSASPATANPQGTVNGLFAGVLEDDGQCSSTSRLQRLLAESKQMVASLERTSLRPLSPTPDCDTVISLSISHDSGSKESSHYPEQSSSHIQANNTNKDSETPPRGTAPFHRTKEPSGQ